MSEKKLVTKLNIGFIKFGLKTYFEEGKNSPQGSNHELVSVWEIMKERGHTCHMISVNDSYPVLKTEFDNLDIIFVFNGPMSNSPSAHKVVMMNNYFLPFVKILNETKVPYIYFRTDPRNLYDIMSNPLIKHKPKAQLTQEPENYGHLDKLILYKKKLRSLKTKDIPFAILMNETNGLRAKNAVKICKALEEYDPVIIGNWKNDNNYVSHPIDSNQLQSFLDQVKYSWNQTVKSNWINQKFWEMILSNVVCLHFNSDSNSLVIPNWLKVDDESMIKSSIELMEKDRQKYDKILNMQKKLIKKEYIDGSLIYETIMSKIGKIK